jgi:hypothetical protein
MVQKTLSCFHNTTIVLKKQHKTLNFLIQKVINKLQLLELFIKAIYFFISVTLWALSSMFT